MNDDATDVLHAHHEARTMTEQRDAAVVEGHKQAERAERLATALRRIRAIASDCLTDTAACDGETAQDMADILSEIQKAGL